MVRSARILFAVFTLPVCAGAQEFQVNTVTTGYQRNVRAAADAQGNFVVVWDSTALDGSGSGVVGQRFDVDGQRIGGEFQINSYTTDGQFIPDVGSDTQGGFVVVWQSSQDGDMSSVHGQLFDATGVPAGGEFQVNIYTTSFQRSPRVAVAPDGDFVVVWSSLLQPGGRVRARFYDSAGNPLGESIPVDPSIGSAVPAVASDGGGNFVVVFTDYYSSEGDIFGRRFDADGDPVGDRFQVNNDTPGLQRHPQVAVDGDGSFVVVWESFDVNGEEDPGVRGRRFDVTATPLRDELQINTFTTSTQWKPGVSGDGDGDGFRVAWGSYLQDGSGWAVVSRRFDAQGDAAGVEMVVNTYTTGFQLIPAILRAGDDFYVFWEGREDQDGDESGVFGRYLATPIFADGFESGDTSAW